MTTATDSPTVLHDALDVRFSRAPLPGQARTTLAKLVAFLAEATRHEHPVVRYCRNAQTTSGDEGYYLMEACERGGSYQSLLPLVFRSVGTFLAEASTPSVLLNPAQIVDSTITQRHLAALRFIEEMTGYSQERIAQLLGVTRQTLDHWHKGKAIKDSNRQRIFAVREVLERVLAQRATRLRLVEWLETPRGADGRTPAQWLAAGDIARARLLALSTPSPQLSRPPAWVRRAVPAAFQAGM